MSEQERESVAVADQWYWLPDEKEVFVLARLTHDKDATKKHVLETTAGVKFPMDEEELQKLEEASPAELTKNPPDITELDDNSHGAILTIMKNNYLNDDISTNLAGVLIVANPFADVAPIKGQTETEIMSMFNGNSQQIAMKPCCLYKTVQQSLLHSEEFHVNTSIVITGESGSGKTHNTTQILKFLAYLNRANAKSSETTPDIEGMLESLAPIMESFGNAKTMLNDNSSRFGRWLEVLYTADGHHRICGSRIQTFLLEKPRVVMQIEGERNFHIFYQILRGGPLALTPKQCKTLGIKEDPLFFKILQKSDVPSSKLDEDGFKDLVNAFLKFGFNKGQQFELFKTIMGIMYLGNVEFVPVGDNEFASVSPETEENLSKAADLFGVSKTALAKGLLEKPYSMPTGESVNQKQKVPAATSMRNTACQIIYDKIFTSMSKILNEHLMKDVPKLYKTFGILDIFGFENLRTNVLEQMLINHTSERLQDLFTKLVFEADQRLFETEGIPTAGIDFGTANYTPALDCVMHPKKGVVRMLASECSLPSGGSVANLMGNLAKSQKKNVAFKRGATENTFIIAHFAGEIEYDASMMIKESKQKKVKFLQPAMYNATNSFLGGDSGIFAKAEEDLESLDLSVGELFKEDLQSLLDVIEKTVPSFIRCIKPNDKKIPKEWDAPKVYKQCIAAGIFEVSKLRRAAFVHRANISFFNTRYKVLFGGKGTPKEVAKQTLEGVRKQIKEHTGEKLEKSAIIGQSMIFYKKIVHHALETLRAAILEECFQLSRAYVMAMLSRKAFTRVRKLDVDMLELKSSGTLIRFKRFREEFVEECPDFIFDNVVKAHFDAKLALFKEMQTLVDHAKHTLREVMTSRVSHKQIKEKSDLLVGVFKTLTASRLRAEFPIIKETAKEVLKKQQAIEDLYESGTMNGQRPRIISVLLGDTTPIDHKTLEMTISTLEEAVKKSQTKRDELLIKNYQKTLFDNLEMHKSVKSLPWDSYKDVEELYTNSQKLVEFEKDIFERCENKIMGTWSSRFIQRRAKPKMVKTLYRRRVSLLELWKSEDEQAWRLRKNVYQRVIERLNTNNESLTLLRKIFMTVKRFDGSKYHQHIDRICEHFQVVAKNFSNSSLRAQNDVFFARFIAVNLSKHKIADAITRREGADGLKMLERYGGKEGVSFKQGSIVPFTNNYTNQLFKKGEILGKDYTKTKIWNDLEHLFHLNSHLHDQFKRSVTTSQKEERFWRTMTSKVFKQLNRQFGEISSNPLESADSINFVTSCAQLRSHQKRLARSRRQIRKIMSDNMPGLHECDVSGQELVRAFIAELWEDKKEMEKKSFVRACGFHSENIPVSELTQSAIMMNTKNAIGRLSYAIRTYAQGEIPSINILVERQQVISGMIELSLESKLHLKDNDFVHYKGIRGKMRESTQPIHKIMRELGWTFARREEVTGKFQGVHAKADMASLELTTAPVYSNIFENGVLPNEHEIEQHVTVMPKQAGSETEQLKAYVDLDHNAHPNLTHIQPSKSHHFCVVTKNYFFVFKHSYDPMPDLQIELNKIKSVTLNGQEITMLTGHKSIIFRVGSPGDYVSPKEPTQWLETIKIHSNLAKSKSRRA